MKPKLLRPALSAVPDVVSAYLVDESLFVQLQSAPPSVAFTRELTASLRSRVAWRTGSIHFFTEAELGDVARRGAWVYERGSA